MSSPLLQRIGVIFWLRFKMLHPFYAEPEEWSSRNDGYIWQSEQEKKIEGK
jgi:hypothetical protein